MFESSPNISYLLTMASELVDHYPENIPSFFHTKFPRSFQYTKNMKMKILQTSEITKKIEDLGEMTSWKTDVWPGETIITVIRLDEEKCVIMGKNVVNDEKIFDWDVNTISDTVAAFYAIMMKTYFDHEKYL